MQTLSKQALAWLFVLGAGLVGWLLWWSSNDDGGPVAAAATQPSKPEPVTVRLTVVTPNGETSKDIRVQTDPVPDVAPASAGGRSGGGATEATAPGTGGPSTVEQDIMVLAHDGAIVLLGDNGKLTANTGDVKSSGAVTIDSVGSTLSTGDSAGSTAGPHLPANDLSAEGVQAAPPGVVNEFTPHLAGRPVAISGYENHSVNVAGNDQIVTYDDSNVFVNRNGEVLSNTGDTDSSGLNALFVVRSTVRSGESADAPPGQEEPEEPDEPEEEEQAATTPATTTAGQAARTLATTATNPADSAAVTDADGGTSASGGNPLVIGADGYDDLGIRSAGNRNVVTYDDSNVVIGGAGPAMTQIGDSDTGGAVMIGIVDSDVRAGNAF